ncbi:hypothetical protein [Streptomyces sp. RFCAC02]|uniref:hypothetical protein n=1 Tax=Streptomyces sp. RFCAC02 TaxID=2499143 RepID=UPI0010212FFE|nr:hypothetical protein [Streptomyces sp. RFCAC02]
MKRRLASLAVPFGVTCAVVAATATPAAAASDARAACGHTWSNTSSPSTGAYYVCGYADFESEVGDGTEQLRLSDSNDDGYGVIVQNYRYDMSDPGPYTGTVTSGEGSKQTWTLHMPEGTKIKFRVCPFTHAHGTYTSLCGAWVTGTA